MAGGISAWEGVEAEGAYDAGMAYFSGASGAEELIALSFALEEGNRVFYEKVARIAREAWKEDAAATFRSLGAAEERHKRTLRDLHSGISGKDADPAHPAGLDTAEGILEGGIPIGEALERVRKQSPEEVLAFAVAMEANALDRYIKMGRAVGDDRSREVFLALAREEQSHLERMSSLMDRFRDR